MNFIRAIGFGYYGIDTEGVTISQDVHDKVDAAFRAVSSIRDEELNVCPFDASSTSSTPRGKVILARD